ncbi:UMP1-domain-containing protein [Cystobasidium minutum MCA 4210]|uniref:UMP1-domain-containing protein n=1 Tax=Cystobasidium minutum MCA 4210 TaxID=1397322 RepID=UPI0034CFF0B7|eukprot:jgi/Rhomi1/197384/gm1.5598_g
MVRVQSIIILTIGIADPSLRLQQPSLALAPSAASTSTTQISHAASKDTLNAQGLHDTLSFGIRNIAAEVAPQHPLEHRLKNWADTQDNLKFTMQRQLYGVHMPVRQLMERSLVGQSSHMPARGPVSNLHLDILKGNDEYLEPSDLFLPDQPQLPLDIHRDMERKLKM